MRRDEIIAVEVAKPPSTAPVEVLQLKTLDEK